MNAKPLIIGYLVKNNESTLNQLIVVSFSVTSTVA